MDENAKRERLEIMIERRIIMEERKEIEKNRRADRHQAFLERQAGVRGLRRSEQAELQKLQRENLAEAQEMRKLIQGARLSMWRMRRDDPARAQQIELAIKDARAEMQRLQKDNSEEARQKRLAIQQERMKRFEDFCQRTQAFLQKEKEAEHEILEAVQQMEESFEKELGQMRTEWEKINKDTEEAYINAAKKVETQFGEEID